MYKCGICIQANFNFLNIPQNIKKKKKIGKDAWF